MKRAVMCALSLGISVVAVAGRAEAEPAGAPEGLIAVVVGSGYGSVGDGRDEDKTQASGVPVWLGLAAVQPVGIPWLAAEAEVNVAYTYGLQEDAKDRVLSLYGRVGLGLRLTGDDWATTFTAGAAWDSLGEQLVLPVGFTVLDRTDEPGVIRQRHFYIGVMPDDGIFDPKGIAIGGAYGHWYPEGYGGALYIVAFGGGPPEDSGGGILVGFQGGWGMTSALLGTGSSAR